MSSEVGGRKLSELRACDLKEELTKRQLNAVGLKNDLMERLKNALKEEGNDPEKYYFLLVDNKRTKCVRKYGENEFPTNITETNGEGILVVNDMTNFEQDIEKHVEAYAENTNDSEESLNLTIGEDEQKLFHEDEDQNKEKIKEIMKEINIEEKVGIKNESGVKQKADSNNIEGTENIKIEMKSESDIKETKTKEEKENATEEKTSDNKSSTSSASVKSHRNLWVSGLTSITRASDLKSIFSKYGKVIGAKVVTNTSTPNGRCYGYLTMGSSSEASRCIDNLHGTELHGRIISVERTKNEIISNKTSHQRKEEMQTSPKECKQSFETEASTPPCKEFKQKVEVDASAKGFNEKIKENESKKIEKDSVDKEKEKLKNIKTENKNPTEHHIKKINDKSERSNNKTSSERRNSRDRQIAEEKERERRAKDRREREMLSFKKIREERERQRLREKERELREEERLRREIRRRQREEENRLAREREKLVLERQKLEREKAELIRLERERQKLEREKIELERLELKRQQMKILEQKSRSEDKRSGKRSSDNNYNDIDRKRVASDRRFEAPPPPRFDSSVVSNSYERSDKKRDDYYSKRDYASKRDDYTSKRDEYSKREEFSLKRQSEFVIPPPPPKHSSTYHSNHGNREDANQKNSRYIESEIRPYRSAQTDRRDPRTANNKRYEVSSSYSDRPSNSTNVVSNEAPWHASSSQTVKTFASNSISNSNNVPLWPNKSNEDKWGRATNVQDRYDRTYSERGTYNMENSRNATVFGDRSVNRYSNQISSRHENEKY